MADGRNTTYVRFQLREATAARWISNCVPLCTYRDYHAHTRGGWSAATWRTSHAAAAITAFPGARAYPVQIDRGDFQREPDWYWNFHHRAEAERGLDTTEDLFRPGMFRVRLAPATRVTFIASAESRIRAAGQRRSSGSKSDVSSLLRAAPAGAPDWVTALTLAADQFIVRARRPEESRAARPSSPAIPWFSDWGRDTMIALPGLALATGRTEDAAAILRTFAAHVSEGMLPNRFPDGGEATRVQHRRRDAVVLPRRRRVPRRHDRTGRCCATCIPSLREIIDWHRRGTRYGIRVDPEDGLLFAGEPGVQLTWMDAKVGDWVVTPRIGKPVEINALWHFALTHMASWADGLNDRRAAAGFENATPPGSLPASRSRFWYPDGGYLYDVIDGPDGTVDIEGRVVDPSLRPNQIFAVSLGTDLLDAARARAVVDVCARELLTPVGLRSLAPSDPRYAGRYTGGSRASATAIYHQGTVWSWLLGPVRPRALPRLRRSPAMPLSSSRRARQPSGRGLPRHRQRDLRWRCAAHTARLFRAGLGRLRNAARLAQR